MEFENGATGVFVTTTADAPGTNRSGADLRDGKNRVRGRQTIFDKLSTNVSDFCKTEREGFKKPEYSRIEIETDGQNEQQIWCIESVRRSYFKRNSIGGRGNGGGIGG